MLFLKPVHWLRLEELADREWPLYETKLLTEQPVESGLERFSVVFELPQRLARFEEQPDRLAHEDCLRNDLRLRWCESFVFVLVNALWPLQRKLAEQAT